MTGPSVTDELPHRVPHRNQFRGNFSEIMERHLASDNTTTEHDSIFQPRFSQSTPQTQHQIVDHGGDFHHAQHFLMSLAITTEEGFVGEIATEDELATILADVAQHSQQRRTHTLHRYRQLSARNAPQDARQGIQLSEGNTLTRRLYIDAHFQHHMLLPRPYKTLFFTAQIRENDTVALEITNPSNQGTKNAREQTLTQQRLPNTIGTTKYRYHEFKENGGRKKTRKTTVVTETLARNSPKTLLDSKSYCIVGSLYQG